MGSWSFNLLRPSLGKISSSAGVWLVAFAHLQGAIVVTNEKPVPLSKNVDIIPDACQEFNVQHINTFSMPRSLGVVFR